MRQERKVAEIDMRKSMLKRRTVLKGAGGLAVANTLGLGVSAARAEAPLKIGMLLPFSGGFELFGQQGEMGLRLCIEEFNQRGGALGRKIEVIRADNKSDPKTTVERARQLIQQDKVDAIIGPITSASRDAVKSTIERAKVPLLYATDYEGGVCSPYMACYSMLPTHYVKPLVPWLIKNYGGEGASVYLFGTDYVWPKKMNAAIKEEVAASGGEVAREEYVPFGVKDFAPTIRKIKDSGANIVILTVPGADGITFVKQFTAAGMKDKVQLAFMGFNENYLPGLSDSESSGIIAASSFIETLDRPEAIDFVRRARESVGKEDATVSYYADSHYGVMKFYLESLEAAGSAESEAVMKAMGGRSLMSGNGEVRMHADDHHVDLNMIISQVEKGKLVLRDYIGRVEAPSQCDI